MPDWLSLPTGIHFRDVTDASVSTGGLVHLLTRDDAAVCVFTTEGKFVKSWQHELVGRGGHGITVAPDSSVYICDWKRHFVAHFTSDGELIKILGTPDKGSDTGLDPAVPDGFDAFEGITHRGEPFNGPTKLAIAPGGDLYVADGYRNAAIHRFSSSGELIQSWGEPGLGPGQFMNPHFVDVASDGRVLVADREAYRVQIFSPDGEFIQQITDLHRVGSAGVDPDGNIAVAELEFQPDVHRSFVHQDKNFRPARLSVFSPDGLHLLYRAPLPIVFEERQGAGPDGLGVDDEGNLYIGYVSFGMYSRYIDPADQDRIPGDAAVIRKLRKSTA